RIRRPPRDRPGRRRSVGLALRPWPASRSDSTRGTPRTPAAARASRASTLPVVREEQLLAVDLVARDRTLTFRRHNPVDERFAEIFLHVRMLGRVDQHDVVLIEKTLVAFDQNREIAAVLEVEPRAAVG